MPGPSLDWRTEIATRICTHVRNDRVMARFREMCAAFCDEKKRDEQHLAVWEQRRKEFCQRGLRTLDDFKARTAEMERLGSDRDAIENARPLEDTNKSLVYDYYQDHLENDDAGRLGDPNLVGMLVGFCAWVPPELALARSPKLTVPELFARFTGGWDLHSPPFGRLVEPGVASWAEKYATLAAIHDAQFPDREPIDQMGYIDQGPYTEEIRKRKRENNRETVNELADTAEPSIREWMADVEENLAMHAGSLGEQTAEKRSSAYIQSSFVNEIAGTLSAMPPIRLWQLLIPLRVDQLEREANWKKAVSAHAIIYAERARKNLTDAQELLVADVDAGRLLPFGQDSPEGQWIDGLKEIDEQAYNFYLHRGNPESLACQALAEEEMKATGAPEWRRLEGDRFQEGGVWRFRTTPWRFIISKLHAERAMPFTEVQLFEAVRLVQLEQADQVALAIRQFVAQQDDSDYTGELLSTLSFLYQSDCVSLGLISGTVKGPDQSKGSTARPALPNASGNAPTAAAADPEPIHVFRMNGAMWELRYEDEQGHFPDLKGFGIVRQLLWSAETATNATSLQGLDPRAEIGGQSTQETLDRETIVQCKQRLADIECEIDEATNNSDEASLARLTGEKEELIAELQGALGLGEKPRRLGPAAAAEKARVAVRRNLDRIDEVLRAAKPPMTRLATHLDRSILVNGNTYAYRPETATNWDLG